MTTDTTTLPPTGRPAHDPPGTGLSLTTVLRRAPELSLTVSGDNTVTLLHRHRLLTFGHHALSLLDVFATPRPIEDALRRVQSRLPGPRAVDEALRTLAQMVAEGVLLTEDPAPFTDLQFPYGGYGLAALNIAILDDPHRKRCFIEAIEDTVGPDDVVLDLGSGSGILAVAAARAGARHVYAVEPARSRCSVQLLADANGVADRITVIQEWSSSLTLPERATVLTTDIVGNEAFDMLILEAVRDARERLLTADARLVPGGFDTYVYLVDVPDQVVERQRVTGAHVERWQDWYGMDFDALRAADADRTVGFYERPEVVREWLAMSRPQHCFSTDLSDLRPVTGGTCELTADRDGVVNGAVLFFQARMSPNVRMDTAPWHGTAASHWFSAVWAFPESRRVRTGDRLAVEYGYAGEGRSWLRPTDVTIASAHGRGRGEEA
jgi:hypothetical protein